MGMSEKDKAAFELKLNAVDNFKGWTNELEVNDVALTFYSEALAHRDEQIKGLVEALKNINQLANKYAGDYPTQIGTISQSALAALESIK